MYLWELTPWGIIHCVRAQKSVRWALLSSAGTVLYLFPQAMLNSLEVREREAKHICKTTVLCWKAVVYLSLSHSQGLVPRQQLLSDQKQTLKFSSECAGWADPTSKHRALAVTVGWGGAVEAEARPLLCEAGLGLVPHRDVQGAVLLQAASAEPTTSGLPKLTLEKVWLVIFCLCVTEHTLCIPLLFEVDWEECGLDTQRWSRCHHHLVRPSCVLLSSHFLSEFVILYIAISNKLA